MKQIKQAVMEKTFEQDGFTCLMCADAYQVADELSVSIGDIGDLCRNEQIKIRGCQLKCFK